MLVFFTALSVFALSMIVQTYQSPRPSIEFESIGTVTQPSFIRVYDQTGILTAEWTGTAVGWLTVDDLLLMYQYDFDGRHLIAGDPGTGKSYWIATLGADWLGSTGYSRLVRIVDLQQSNPGRLLLLPSSLIWFYRSGGYPDHVGALTVLDGEVHRDGKMLLPDRGLRYQLGASPSGRWTAVVEEQGACI